MQLDEDKIELIRWSLQKPRTIREMVIIADVSRRTIFRWLKLLESRGWSVRRVNINRPTKYQITGVIWSPTQTASSERVVAN